MKDAAYVGVTTAVYREALDAALADPEGLRGAARVAGAARAELLAQLHDRAPRGPPRRGAQRRPRGAPRRAGGSRERVRRGRRARSSQAEQAGRRRRRRLPVHALGPDGAAAAGGGRRREHHAARARARRRQGPPVPPRGGRCGELAHATWSPGASPAPDRAVACASTGEEGATAALAVDELALGGEVGDGRRRRSRWRRRARPHSPRPSARGASAPWAARRTGSRARRAIAGGSLPAVGELKDLRRRAVAALDERRLAARRRRAAALAGSGSAAAAPRAAPPSPAAPRPRRRAAALERAPSPPGRPAAAPGEAPLAAPGGGASASTC